MGIEGEGPRLPELSPAGESVRRQVAALNDSTALPFMRALSEMMQSFGEATELTVSVFSNPLRMEERGVLKDEMQLEKVSFNTALNSEKAGIIVSLYYNIGKPAIVEDGEVMREITTTWDELVVVALPSGVLGVQHSQNVGSIPAASKHKEYSYAEWREDDEILPRAIYRAFEENNPPSQVASTLNNN